MTSKNVVTYRPKALYNLLNGFVLLTLIFFLLTLPVLVAGESVASQKLLALSGFWIVGILLTILPFGFKLEIGDDYVKSYFLGFCISDISDQDVQEAVYGNMFYGGLGFGRALNIRARVRGKSKVITIGERMYGKEVIEHARRTLRPSSN